MSILVACFRFFRTKLWTLFLIAISFAFILLAFSYFQGQNTNVLHSGKNDYGVLAGGDRNLPVKGGRKGRRKSHFWLDEEDDEQVCSPPRFRATTHEEAPAPPPLSCDGQDLFLLRNGALQINDAVLRGRKLDRCIYTPIDWLSDNEYAMRRPYVVNQEPFYKEIRYDFFKIECFLAKGAQNFYQRRRLLQDGEPEFRPLNDQIRPRVNHQYQGLPQPQEDAVQQQQQQQQQKQQVPNKAQIESENSQAVPRRYPNAMGSMGLPDLPGPLSPRKATNLVQNDAEPAAKQLDNLPAVPVAVKQDEPQLVQDTGGAFGQGNAPRLQDINVASLQENKKYEDTNEGKPANAFESDRPDFEQFIARINLKPETFRRVEQQKVFLDSLQTNVLIIGVESMSRLDFQKKLPETYAYLKTMDAVILNGYNIVGDATMGALLPMLTGKNLTELPDASKTKESSIFLEGYPFIWNKFESSKFVTLYAEDYPARGTFQQPLNGWEDPPVDHYMRTFWMAVEDSKLGKTSKPSCLGGRPKHLYTLDYVRQFFRQYKGEAKFAMALFKELTHEDNSLGHHLDGDLLKLLRDFGDDRAFENTLLVVMGDHGVQHGDKRNTPQGKLEERLPMMSLVLPDTLKDSHPEWAKHLRTNEDRLTTPFDIYQTLLSLVHSRTASETSGQRTTRGISLFKDVPVNRTCESAGVGVHWCACAVQIEARVNSEEVERAAKTVVLHINKKLDDTAGKCETLTLKRIIKAYVVIPDASVKYLRENGNFNPRTANMSNVEQLALTSVHYQVTFETTPNNVRYEATVLVDRNVKTYTITDDVSRTSAYEKTNSQCIIGEYPELRKFCQCSV